MAAARMNLRRRVPPAIALIVLTLACIVSGGWIYIGLISVCAAIIGYEWARLALKSPYPWQLSVAGVVYLSFCFIACYLVRESLGVALTIAFVIMVWMSDTGAYFSGKLIGGPKLVPRLSPNKTWAGLGGAVAGPVFAALAYAFYADFEIAELAFFTAIGVIVGLTGQTGDLLSSGLKRLAGAKDASGLIPGHGGLLDRMDALIFAAPFYLVLMLWHGTF
ncbi:MAG: phosphatidate cytidylyltransferase [Alphaproteobacteria bacterium]|nr:phosphatidate cytidylyltransferase [Alphaproteobacteria bacterium]